MAKKRKKTKSKKSKKTNKYSLETIKAQRNFSLFLILFMVSFLLYSFSVNVLFANFFGVLSILFGFVALAFLIALVTLLMVKSKK